jgi:gas vesicle protein
MKSTLKPFLFGLIIGAIVASWPVYNYGRGAPLYSNPFEKRTLGTIVKEKAEGVVEGAREKLHDVTKPAR